MTEREKFEAYFKPIAEGMKSCGIGTVGIERRKDQQWEGWRVAIALHQQADDGWIEWDGTNKSNGPVSILDTVEIKFRDGSKRVATNTCDLDWYWHGRIFDADIIAYRVVKP